MIGCAAFVVLMLASLVYVCSRPQTASVEAAEAVAIRECRKRSVDTSRTEIARAAARDSCSEMEEQYVHKFGAMPAP